MNVTKIINDVLSEMIAGPTEAPVKPATPTKPSTPSKPDRKTNPIRHPRRREEYHPNPKAKKKSKSEELFLKKRHGKGE
jgi:hypothetical protein